MRATFVFIALAAAGCGPAPGEPEAVGGFAAVSAQLAAEEMIPVKSADQQLYDACIAPHRWADYEREAGDDVRRCMGTLALKLAGECETRTLREYRNGTRPDLGGRYGEAIKRECAASSRTTTEAMVAEWRVVETD
jgi:hypothetical protein